MTKIIQIQATMLMKDSQFFVNNKQYNFLKKENFNYARD